uniref:Cathepsin L1 cysteine protease n=1 Tax=Pinctada fucata TaxID=50426 RepID=D3XLA0_PINFU|nr:cathepsin L1 cysteine protease [Pinctada fucata]
MFRLVVVAALCVAALATPVFRAELDQEWAIYKDMFAKNYVADEERMRRLVWEDNIDYIEKHNRRADRGEHKFWLGTNEYADMTIDEFKAIMNGFIMQNGTKGDTYMSPSNIGDLPDKVDWRDKGYVTPVKNQGHCGSCWSFSATGSLEGQHFKSTGKLVSLSEQNLIDCSKKEGNHGCKGGLMDFAFEYIQKNDGIDTEQSYPYTAKDGIECRFKKADVGATDKGKVDLPRQSEKALQEAVATVGPISVAMDAGHRSFQLYKRGIYTEPMCSSTKLDHGVLAVGYGSEGEGDYWLVKNSWGATWGMEGFFMLARNHRNECGIATQASYPKV